MRFFTPALYLQLQDRDPAAMDAADAAWETAVQRYDASLQAILPDLPASVRQLVEGPYLHDAKVLSAGCQDQTFGFVLQLDVPPHELLSLTYDLAGEPIIDRAALPAEHRSGRMTWQYEELEVVTGAGDTHYLHSILFSNGWEIRIPFRDVRLTTAWPVYPCPDGATTATAIVS